MWRPPPLAKKLTRNPEPSDQAFSLGISLWNFPLEFFSGLPFPQACVPGAMCVGSNPGQRIRIGNWDRPQSAAATGAIAHRPHRCLRARPIGRIASAARLDHRDHHRVRCAQPRSRHGPPGSPRSFDCEMEPSVGSPQGTTPLPDHQRHRHRIFLHPIPAHTANGRILTDCAPPASATPSRRYPETATG